MAGVNVRKRGTTWQYQFEAAKVDGKRKQITKGGFRTKADAIEAGTKALAEYNNSGLHFEPSDISVADFFDLWLKEYCSINLKYNSTENYERIVQKHIKPKLGHYKLKSLTSATLQTFINNIYTSGYSESMLMNIKSTISGALNYAVSPMNFIKNNPMLSVKKPSYRNSTRKNTIKSRNSIPPDIMQSIFERFPEGNNFYIPLMIGYHCGLRISECFGLTWDDVDFDNGYIDINKQLQKNKTCWVFNNPKYNSNRRIKVGTTLLKALQQHKKKQLENEIFYGEFYTNTYIKDNVLYEYPKSLNIQLKGVSLICRKENGEFLTSDSFKYCTRIVHYQLNIADFDYHSIRHTHATMLLSSGANIKDIQERLGHKDIQTTLNIYSHVTESMRDSTVDILERLVNQC